MKRLLTYLSAIIIMMMVPIGVSAWTSINLRGGSYDWNNNSSGSDFKKWDDNNFVKAVTPSTTGNYYFRYYVNDDGGFQCGPDDADNDWLLTVNGTDLTTATKGKTTKAFYFAATAGETYYISVRYVSSTWKVSVSNKPIVRIGGCIGGQNYSWDNDKAPYMAYDSTEDAWYYDVSASDFSSWKRSGEGLIGLDFRFREVNGEQLYYVFSTGSENNAHTTLTSTYQELASNTSGADNRFVGVEEVANATNYRVWYKNDNGTRKAKVEVTTSAPVTTTATLTIGGNDITGTNNGSNYYFDIPADKYTAGSPMSFTLKTETGGTATYYTGDFTGSASGDNFACSTSPSSATMSYTVPSNASGPITVTLNAGEPRVTFAYQTSGGGGGTTTDAAYYLVGNFFNDDTSINYDKRYFKFNKQSDGSYMVEIPATVTANTQILSVDGSTTAVYGPGSSHGIHADSGDGNGGWPATDGNVTGNLTKSTTLALNNNYWELTTRNNNTSAGDDDGLYEVSFTLNSSGVPSTWKIKHVSTKRVVYFLSTATGAVATPLYDKRNNANAAYSNATKGYLHFDASNQYWVLSNIVYKDIIENTGDYYCGTNLGAHKNNRSRDILPTTNKLVYKGNGNRVFATDKYGNEVSPNEQAIAANYLNNNQNATYEVQYNPSNGDGDLAKSGNHWGMRGQIQFLGGTNADDNIKTVSMVGPAIPGTTSGSTWTWDSTVGDMTWDVTENCYKLTLTTTAAAGQHFRFVANHTQAKNFYETNTTARIPYDGTATSGTSAATEEDPNDVAYTTSGTTSNTDSSYDILFNRPAGEWTVRFYLTYDKDQNKSFYYTITGTENPDPSVVTTTINTAGGLYINKVLVDVAYTGDSSTPLYWKVGGAPTTSDNLVSYTDSENNTDNRKFLLSTPGQLYVGDGTNTSDPVTFDFTYSTSENYVGVEKNGTVSQIVTSKGGKDCVNVFFKKSYKDMSIYVWDANAESGKEYLTKVWPGQWMSDDRTLTLNGETFYYVSFPTSDLKPKDGKYKIGFILSNAALGSSKENADATKTRDYFLEFNATDTNVQGVQETMFYALEANVTANKVYEPAGSTYESQEKSTYKGSAAQLFSTNTVYFKNDDNWTSPIYCHVWKADGTKLHEWQSNGEMMTLVDAEKNIYAYTIPSDYQYKLAFTSKKNNSEVKTGNFTFSGNGGRMYTASTSSWGDAPSSFTTLDAASQTVMNTFLTTPPVTTVESRVYPNGQDYYRNMPNDYTLMLSNEWKHADEPPVVDEQHQESSWQVTSGKHWSGDTNKTYLHIRKNEAYQTVTNLPAGTYTVQAIVRGGGVPVYMKLNDTQVASIILTSDGSDAKTTINQFGRSEQLVEMSTDNTKRGWHKLEGSITLATPGDLKIAVRTDYTADGGSIDLADVFLLKDANTPGNYWTTAPTSETDTEYDMSNRTNYNAFSFFDRGANLNSIIKASDKTVIGMSAANEPYGATDRRHPCNVVTSSDGGTTWHTPMLALTDYASVIVGSEAKYGNSQYVSQHTYGTSFDYTADKFSYDRATSAKMMSTMLPFALTRSQIESMLGDGVKTYTLKNIDKSNLKVTFKETTDNLEAHTPFFFRPLQSETKSKMALNESVSVVAKSGTSSTSPSSPAQGLLGTYKHISDVGTTYKDQDFIPYFYENNTFVWADNDANAKPFRVIFLLNKGGNNARMLNAIFVDDTTTGIDGITENIQQNAPVYSIDGKLVSSDGDTSRLSKGVYVKAGKKFIIK